MNSGSSRGNSKIGLKTDQRRPDSGSRSDGRWSASSTNGGCSGRVTQSEVVRGRFVSSQVEKSVAKWVVSTEKKIGRNQCTHCDENCLSNLCCDCDLRHLCYLFKPFDGSQHSRSCTRQAQSKVRPFGIEDIVASTQHA
jgi:hypothetical protein